jgi:hypothetical protein
MPLTARQLNRATLARQMLLAREPVTVPEAVHRVVALQAQEPASPYIALWNRIAGFDPADLDVALSDRTVIRSTSIRITLHAVEAGDYAPFHEAMQTSLRDSRLNDRRFKASGLTIADADALVSGLVEFTAEPRTPTEIEAMLGERLGAPPHRGVWWALRTYAPLHHSPTGGPWSFGPKTAFRGAAYDPIDHSLAVQHLLLRYLAGFGPATPQDCAQFALLRQPTVLPAVAALGDQLVTMEGPGGSTLYDLPDGPMPDGDAPAPPRLMAMWDETLLAYADRSRIVPPEYRQLVMRRNGDVLPTLLVDGLVAGVWRPIEGGIEASAFRELSHDVWHALEAEAKDLVRLLDARERLVYRRYARWWAELPVVESEVLAGWPG